MVQRWGTNDINDDLRKKTHNEIRKRNSNISMNDNLMDFPTKADRETYRCSLFLMVCNCGNSERAVIFSCSRSNPENLGKVYYGFPFLQIHVIFVYGK